jgi:hypothetical protein
MGPGAEIALDYSYAYGQGAAVLDDGSRTAGRADYYWSQLAVIPRRLEARISPVAWMDVGGQIGWVDGGANVRIGLPARPGDSRAFQLAAGFDTDEAGLYKDWKAAGSKWVRLEAYPLLPLPGGKTRLVLAGGIDFGLFHHELDDPRPPEHVSDVGLNLTTIRIIRRETRLETSVGLFIPGRFVSALITVSPYFVVDADNPDKNELYPIASYRQSWGIAFVSRLALRHAF